MFYGLKVTYGNLEFYYHEDFYKAAYSPNVMKISTELLTVPTYALDWATIVAHIPWISQLFIKVTRSFVAIKLLTFCKNIKKLFYCSRELSLFWLIKSYYLSRMGSIKNHFQHSSKHIICHFSIFWVFPYGRDNPNIIFWLFINIFTYFGFCQFFSHNIISHIFVL